MNKTGINKVSSAKEGITKVKPLIRRSALARKLLIKGESVRLFEEMRARILSETVPQTEIEHILVEKIISATWRLQRAMEVEKNLLNQQNAIADEEKFGSAWDDTPVRKRIRNIKKVRVHGAEVQHIIQYQIELEKGLQKAIGRLRDEQALRKLPIHKHD